MTRSTTTPTITTTTTTIAPRPVRVDELSRLATEAAARIGAEPDESDPTTRRRARDLVDALASLLERPDQGAATEQDAHVVTLRSLQFLLRRLARLEHAPAASVADAEARVRAMLAAG